MNKDLRFGEQERRLYLTLFSQRAGIYRITRTSMDHKIVAIFDVQTILAEAYSDAGR